MQTLAVAAVSARMLAEAAGRDGYQVEALDLFGDADTRRASARWHSIGEPANLSIDGDRFLAALTALAREGRVHGWIAGAGFEGRPDLLECGAALLPLVGTQAEAMRRVRDPQLFFGLLDAEDIAHPETRTTPPRDAAGWLVKDAGACGGWHIRRAPEAPAPGASHYFQREMPGRPMSATFVANGRGAAVLGFNQQIVRSIAGHPYVFCGAVGPVALPAAVANRVKAAVRTLASAFRLQGLGSLDFLLDGDAIGVLEVNARPSASLALYGSGVLRAHVEACLHGALPQWPTPAPDAPVRGTEIVFAPHPASLDASALLSLAERDGCHDLPIAAMRFAAGEPMCSVSASGADAGHVHELLERSRDAVHRLLEPTP